MNVDPDLFQIIEEMMWEFMDNKLESSKDWGDHRREATFKRSSSSSNPEWYRNMCKDFPRPVQPSQPRIKKKKPRTIVKRQETLKLLNRLLEHGKSESKYAPYVIDEAQRRLDLCPDETIKKFDNQF